MRRLLFLASAMVLFEVAFFAAIAPLLPGYVDDLGLSKAQAGILSAAYAAGSLVASLPAGFVASRVGPRLTVICGLLGLGSSSLVFGLVDQILLLDAARFVQGLTGALVWAGAMTWLITSSPDEARGSVIGTALGTAVAGSLIGPALGAAAASVGTGLVFGSMFAVSALLAAAAARIPEVRAPERQDLGEVVETILSRPIVVAAAFVAVPSLMFGALEVLVPLRIHSLGGGHGLIAGGFIAGAALEAGVSPISGRFSDRVGRRSPYVLGLAICTLAMIAFALAQTLGTVVAALIVASFGAGLCFAPAMTLLSDAAEVSRMHQGFAAGVSGMAWAAGQVLGGIGGGVAASLTGNAAPSIAIAALLIATIAYAYRAMTPDADPRGPAEPRPAEG
jgi:MFS family permease